MNPVCKQGAELCFRRGPIWRRILQLCEEGIMIPIFVTKETEAHKWRAKWLVPCSGGGLWWADAACTCML